MHISDPPGVHPAHVTFWIERGADKMFVGPQPLGLDIDKPNVPVSRYASVSALTVPITVRVSGLADGLAWKERD